MKAVVKITKSFDKGRTFRKEYERGDFKDFFYDEGDYLDRLCDKLFAFGESGEFTVSYKVCVKNEVPSEAV